MKDKVLIEDLITRLEEAEKKVRNHFSGFDLETLNRKLNPETWSIGQCLDHLLVSDCAYFPGLKKITEEKKGMGFWEKWSPFSGLLGKVLVSQVGEYPKKNMHAPKVFIPSSSEIDMGILERFYKHLDTLKEFMALSKDLDLDKIRITSPVSSFITYSLRNAYLLLVQHEHRHINQAIKLKQKMNL
jgi:hypothetical protein